jgi:hypothetical protein
MEMTELSPKNKSANSALCQRPPYLTATVYPESREGLRRRGQWEALISAKTHSKRPMSTDIIPGGERVI